MTDIEKRIALAEWMGWTKSGDLWQHETTSENPVSPSDLLQITRDFIYDCECKLMDLSDGMPLPDLWDRYELELQNVCHFPVHADSDKRAEALLKTIGKWKE